MNALYLRRRDTLFSGLQSLGWKVRAPEAAFYFWCRVPDKKMSSMAFSKLLLDRCGLVVTPGIGFGKCGEGYIRFTLTVPENRIREAVRRLKKVINPIYLLE